MSESNEAPDEATETLTEAARLVKRREVYRGLIVRVELDEVILPGSRAAIQEVVRHPGAVAVVPLVDPDHVLLLRQYRYAVGGAVLEIPAGKLDPGEEPIDCARRELAEETGYRARFIEPLGSILPSPGFTDEVIWLFVASGLSSGETRLEDDEILEPLIVGRRDAVSWARDGRIRDAKSVCALLRLGAE